MNITRFVAFFCFATCIHGQGPQLPKFEGQEVQWKSFHRRGLPSTLLLVDEKGGAAASLSGTFQIGDTKEEAIDSLQLDSSSRIYYDDHMLCYFPSVTGWVARATGPKLVEVAVEANLRAVPRFIDNLERGIKREERNIDSAKKFRRPDLLFDARKQLDIYERMIQKIEDLAPQIQYSENDVTTKVDIVYSPKGEPSAWTMSQSRQDSPTTLISFAWKKKISNNLPGTVLSGLTWNNHAYKNDTKLFGINFDLKDGKIMVHSIYSGSPAISAGILPGAVVTAVDGVPANIKTFVGLMKRTENPLIEFSYGIGNLKSKERKISKIAFKANQPILFISNSSSPFLPYYLAE